MILDAIIVGQGLAGTSLAWALLERGADILVLDREEGPNASSVAAGLVTPVTGRALSSPPGFMRDRAVAAEHYRSIERRTAVSFWQERAALRLFASDEDVERRHKRKPALGNLLTMATPPPATGFAPFAQAAEMPDAARLDVANYLQASRATFKELGCYECRDVDTSAFRFDEKGVRIDGIAHSARHVVLCGGSWDEGSAWLPERALSPAKGEIVTVRIDRFDESRTAHRGGHWLVPTGQPGLFRFGATYDHKDRTAAPTRAARAHLVAQLAQMVSRDFDVVDQQAGVRPVGAQRRPIVGAHPVRRRVVVFNGLGSRGVLWAPRLARELAARLCDRAGPDAAVPPIDV